MTRACPRPYDSSAPEIEAHISEVDLPSEAETEPEDVSVFDRETRPQLPAMPQSEDGS